MRAVFFPPDAKAAPLSYRRTFAIGMVCSTIAFLGAFSGRAANPPTGSVSPTIGSTVSFIGNATGSGAPEGEGDCVDGVNCDTFEVTITGQPTDYIGKVVAIRIDWTVPANDYDLVIHKGTVDGPILASSGNGPPLIYEKAAIRPYDHGTGKYVVHVIYFATTPQVDQYHGTATTQVEPAVRTGNYLKGGGISFSPNVTVKAPVARRDGEPSSRTDFKGNCYVGGIRGVPAGVDLWYFDLNPSSPTYDALMRNPFYRGQPDEFASSSAGDLGADGGGDIDLAVGFGVPAGQTDPTLAFSSLVLANVSTGNTKDRAQTYNHNPAGNVNGAPVNDRQWQEFFDDHIEFLTYRTFDPVVGVVQRSTDGGLTYENGTVLGGVAQNGGIDVNHQDGTVYISYNDGRVAVGIPASPGLAPASYAFHQAVDDPNGSGHLFCTVKVAEDGTPNGTAYVCFSNGKHVFLAHSVDKGATWSVPVRVSDLPNAVQGGTSLFPCLETGPTQGSVAIAWYGAVNQPYNNSAAEWRVYFAQTFNATAQTPTFTQVEASDHVIHASNISEGGLNGAANRNLLDYFQISFDPNGAAVVGYTDDHNDFTGHVYVMKQIAGPSIKGGSISLPNPIPPVVPPPGDAAPPPQPGPNGEQVTDFALDAASGTVLTRITSPNPTDILSIKYGSSGTGSTLMLTATTKLSLLSATLPPNATYRMNFAANAPNSFLSASGDYTYGLPDRGNQFFVSVTTDQSGTPTFRYGTAVRNSDGSVTYTNRGIADSGSIDPAAGTLTVNVLVSKLNATMPGTSSPIGIGSVLVGLRGSASGGGQSDETRGGTLFVVGGGRVSAVSRKVHGAAGPFDINLPLTGSPGIECRTGGASGNYQVVIRFPFANTVSVGGFTLSAPKGGSVSNFSVAGREATVNLTGITNEQTITITLNGVNDGTNLGNLVIPMIVLLGDTTANRAVNSSDIAQTQSQSGQSVSSSNFREDVTVNGAINSSDIALVQSKSGTAVASVATTTARTVMLRDEMRRKRVAQIQSSRSRNLR